MGSLLECFTYGKASLKSSFQQPLIPEEQKQSKKGAKDSSDSTSGFMKEEINKKDLKSGANLYNYKLTIEEFPNEETDFSEGIRKKMKELEDEKKKLREINEKTMNMYQELAVEKEILEGKNLVLEKEVKNLFESKELMEKKYKELNEKQEVFLEKIVLDKSSNNYRDENEQTISINERTVNIQDKENELEGMREKLAEKHKKITDYKKKLEDYVKELKKYKEELKDSKEEIESTQKRLEDTQSELETTKEKRKELKNAMVTLTKEKEELNGVQKEIQRKYKELCKHLGLTDSNKKKKKSSKQKNSSPYTYDIVINIDSLVSKEYGWSIERNENLLSSISPKESYSIIGLVGRENIGKTYILNKICDLDLPCGTNVNTKGLSLKYANNRNLICLDSAGIGTPVYYYSEDLMKRFGVTKEDLKRKDELRHKMIDDRTLTDVFIQDFILDVCEVIIIVVGQLSQYDQKFIERVASKYKAKKKIVVIHNFSNLYSTEDVERKIQRDIVKVYETTERYIPNTEIPEYIEKINDKVKENISHLVLGVEWSESGKKFNEPTLKYLKDILDTRIEKKSFNLVKQLTKFMEDYYRLYFQFKEIPKEGFTLNLNKDETELKIKTDGVFEVSNPIFNSLGTLVTNPPYEIFERIDKFICLIELPNLKLDETLKFKIDKKSEYACLIIKGEKKGSELEKGENLTVVGTRNHGEIECKIPLGSRDCKMKVKEKEFKYKKGILMVEVERLLDESEEL